MGPSPGLRPRRRASAALLAALLLAPAAPGEEEDAFEVRAIPSRGRTLAAEIVELDGDGRADLLQVAALGTPPAERRVLRVYLQARAGGADGAPSLPARPSFERPLPAGAAAYDLAELRESPGRELLLLERDGLRVLSLAAPDAPSWRLPIPGRTTVGAAADDRSLRRLRLLRDELGPEPLLVVPLFGRTALLSREGELRGELETGARANYFIPPADRIGFFESDVQLFFDAPHLSVADVDGDGRADLVASSRHEIRIFLCGEDGRFPSAPSRTLAVGLLTPEDHIRGSGSVSAQARDLDGDGRAELLLTHISGSPAAPRTESRLYANRDGGWSLESPAQVLVSEKTLGADSLVDVDGDGRAELVRAGILFGALEMIEALVTRSADVRLEVYRADARGPGPRFGREPWLEKRLALPFSFDTLRPRGFLPRIQVDLNGDGHLDLLRSGGGEELEILLGGPERPWAEESAQQELETAGILRLGDLEGDGLPDLLLFDPARVDAPLRLARNRGRLPGAAPRPPRAVAE